MIEIYDRTDLEVIKQYEDFISNGEKDKASQLRATFILKSYFESDVIGTLLQKFIQDELKAINNLFYLSEELHNRMVYRDKKEPRFFSSINTFLLMKLFEDNQITRKNKLHFLRSRANYEFCTSAESSEFNKLFTYAILDTLASDGEFIPDTMLEHLIKYGENNIFFLNNFFRTYIKISNSKAYPDLVAEPANIDMFCSSVIEWYVRQSANGFKDVAAKNDLREALLVITALYLFNGDRYKAKILVMKVLEITSEEHELYWLIRFLNKELSMKSSL